MPEMRGAWARRLPAVVLTVVCAVHLLACVPTPYVTPTSPPPTGVPPAGFPGLDGLYLGLYSVYPEDLIRVAEAGLSIVSVPPASVGEMTMYVEAASDLGLRVRLSLSPSYLDLDESQLIAYLENLARQPGIVMWYLPEEPKTDKEHDQWKRLYELVKAHDPLNRPVGLYLAGGATIAYFQKWTDTCDVFMMGAYPEYYDIPRAALFTRVHNASVVATEHGMLTVAVPQFFDLESVLALKGQSAMDERLHVGHPNAWEFRADAYAGLIAGASGLDWYSLKHAGYPDLWESMTSAVAELNLLAPALSRGQPGPELRVTILTGPETVPSFKGMSEGSVQKRAYEHEGVLYVLAVSLADVPIAVQLHGLPASLSQMEVMFEGRTTPVAFGELTDRFQPHEVHVYRAMPAAGNEDSDAG